MIWLDFFDKRRGRPFKGVLFYLPPQNPRQHNLFIFFRTGLDFRRYISYDCIVATKGGEIIGEKKKMGRPTDSPKDIMFRVRLDEQCEHKLNISAEKLNISKSDVVRKGIELVHDSLDKK